jgi:hypothetical protein
MLKEEVKGIGLVNAYDPSTHEEASYILMDGPEQDTFSRAKALEAKLEAIAGQEHARGAQTALAFLLPLQGLIRGDEPVIPIEPQAESLKLPAKPVSFVAPAANLAGGASR